jgi:hypothetical protein
MAVFLEMFRTYGTFLLRNGSKCANFSPSDREMGMNISPKLEAISKTVRTEAQARVDALLTDDIYLVVCAPRCIDAFIPEARVAQLTCSADLLERLDQASSDSWSMRVIKVGRHGDRADISKEVALEWAAKMRRAGREWDEVSRIPFIDCNVTEDHWGRM